MSQNNKSIDKKNKNAELKLSKILNKIETLKLSNSYISQIKVPKLQNKTEDWFMKKINRNPKYFAMGALLVLMFGMGVQWWYKEFSEKDCLLAVPSSTDNFFRPPEDCSMCEDVADVVRLANISAQEFEEKYAYSTAPVIVTDATADWKAIKEFNFKFFADFYRTNKLGKQINTCSFFAYKSGLTSLEEVFNMDEARANLSGPPWYVGWSTCYSEETRQLRSFYNRPYFLPKTAESDMVDWIFMGGPGQGAHMHVDSLKYVSWQAQIRGRKQWQLAPPPECFYRCRRWLSFTVQPGEILVVDTNRWYHKTNVLPGDISITIGAEYD